jgi:type IV secretory pathway VirD2 relaxase
LRTPDATIMNTDPRIRVIKLAERKRRARARVKKGRAYVPRPEQAEDKARNAAAAVAGWVDELRRQKQQAADATGDFSSLFKDPA